MRVTIYVEGGGEGELLDTLFRQGWRLFFEAAGLTGRMPKIVRGKGRTQTFRSFRIAVANPQPGELPLLLVDSEGPVQAGHSVWQHLKTRDNWDRPGQTSDDQAFLMVQVMETWFLLTGRRSSRISARNYVRDISENGQTWRTCPRPRC